MKRYIITDKSGKTAKVYADTFENALNIYNKKYVKDVNNKSLSQEYVGRKLTHGLYSGYKVISVW